MAYWSTYTENREQDIQNVTYDAPDVVSCGLKTEQQITHETEEFDINPRRKNRKYEGWNFNSGNYLFTTDTK